MLVFRGERFERWIDGLWYGPAVEGASVEMDLARLAGLVGVTSRTRCEYRYYLRPAAWAELAEAEDGEGLAAD